MSKKKNSYRPHPILTAAVTGPRFVRWLMLAGAVCVVHALAALFIGLEADSSGEILLMSMVAAFVIGMGMAAADYNFLATAAAAGGPPAVWAKWHWYWKADMHSPAGAAQSLVEWLFSWTPPPPAHYSLLGVLTATGLIGWLGVRVNAVWEKKTGRPLISLDE